MKFRKLKKLHTKSKRHLRIKRNKRRLTYLSLFLIIFSLYAGLLNTQATSSNRQEALVKLRRDITAVQKEKAVSQSEIKAKAAHEAALKAEIDNLNKQLQAKLEQKQQQKLVAKVQAVVAPPVSAATCGDNEYANFIYMHESGCNPSAVNAGGCRGIGQACPGSKLPCGADYACQNEYFSAYANRAYGGWAGAYAFWLSHNWW